MSTIKNNAFNYEAYVQENSPISTRIQRSNEARRQRFEAAIIKYAIRTDEEILAQFQKLVPEGQDYKKSIKLCDVYQLKILRSWHVQKFNNWFKRRC